MRVEKWKSIQHLLITWAVIDEETIEILLPVINLVRAILIDIKIQILILSEQKFGFYEIAHHVKSEHLIHTSQLNQNYVELIDRLQQHSFDAALILTTPTQSPFSLAYLCYLAGIPLRFGQSQEFGGGVLSHCIKPPLNDVAIVDYNLHLLQALGLFELEPDLAIA